MVCATYTWEKHHLYFFFLRKRLQPCLSPPTPKKLCCPKESVFSTYVIPVKAVLMILTHSNFSIIDEPSGVTRPFWQSPFCAGQHLTLFHLLSEDN